MNQISFKNFINWPNIFTLIALFLACLAIIFIFKGSFYISFFWATLAFIIDFLDGFLARKTNKVSDFGRQLDSQVDVFIYLLYPSLFFYFYFSLNDIFSLICIFLFLAAGIFRLVRFNVLGYIVNENGNNYSGLPVVFSHLLIVIFWLINFWQLRYFVFLADFFLIVTSFLMLASFPFPKPKNIKPFIALLIIFAVLSLFLDQYGFDK